jgi:hypothetical protein
MLGEARCDTGHRALRPDYVTALKDLTLLDLRRLAPMFALGDLFVGGRSSWQRQGVIHQRIYLNYGRTSFWRTTACFLACNLRGQSRCEKCSVGSPALGRRRSAR